MSMQKLERAVHAVLDLHMPIDWPCAGVSCSGGEHPPIESCCRHCLDLGGSHVDAGYPCATVRAVREAVA